MPNCSRLLPDGSACQRPAEFWPIVLLLPTRAWFIETGQHEVLPWKWFPDLPACRDCRDRTLIGDFLPFRPSVDRMFARSGAPQMDWDRTRLEWADLAGLERSREETNLYHQTRGQIPC